MRAPRRPNRDPRDGTRGRPPRIPTERTNTSKYATLTKFLQQSPDGPLGLTFDDIATVVPGGLPSAAYRHRGWWSNGATDRSHVQAQAWLKAGRTVTAVDLETRRVQFSATKPRPLGR